MDIIDLIDTVRAALRAAGIQAGPSLSETGRGDFEIYAADGTKAVLTLELKP